MRAFNWAEKYQIPVILLVDKYLAESQISILPFNMDIIKIERGSLITGRYDGEEEYRKHKFTDSGVSPRAVPSTRGAIVRTNADEHNEYGYTSEDPEMTAKMMDKRMRKLQFLTEELDKRNIETTKLYGSEGADVTVISWGSTKGPIIEALKLLNQDITVNYLQILYLHPFPTLKVKKILDKAGKTIVVENNYTSQVSSLIRDQLLTDVDHKILKYDGRPFSPQFLSEKIKEVL
jgi:2-oxoglutarate ferredoxin oxidoreductase subunit alpha